MKLTDRIRDWVARGAMSVAGAQAFERQLKSLRDGQSGNGDGSAVVVVNRGNVRQSLYKKQNVATLRAYAEYSIWVRAAIDIYRQAVGGAEQQLVPIDKERRMDQRVYADVQALMDRANPSKDPYSAHREMMVEDYLVLGHGVIEKKLRKDLAVYELYARDAAKWSFIKEWDGSNTKVPRYAVMAGQTDVERYVPNEMAMVMVNRRRTYDQLGLSHVETLDIAVRTLLSMDEWLYERTANPTPSGVVNLGPGFNQAQLDGFRAQLQQIKQAFAVVSSDGKTEFTDFKQAEQAMRALDQSIWFVRQVAAIFQVSTAKLRLAVDLSRANAKEMFQDDTEGPGALLSRIEQVENRELLGSFGTPAEHNIKLVFPALSKRDEAKQAEVASTTMNGMRWAAINEARVATGLPEIDLSVANEVLVEVGQNLMPLSLLEESVVRLREEMTRPANQNPPANPGEDAPEDSGEEDAAQAA